MIRKLIKTRAREASSYAGLSALLVLIGAPAEAGPLIQVAFDGITAIAAFRASTRAPPNVRKRTGIGTLLSKRAFCLKSRRLWMTLRQRSTFRAPNSSRR